MKLLAALCVLPFLVGNAFAQQATDVFEHLSIEEGLSQSIVECILQDSRGFMWFGTQDGLNKYDGYQFVVMRENPRSANSLSTNYITALCEDRDGKIWIGTFNGGLNRYDPVSDAYVRYRSDVNDPGSLASDLIRVVRQDRAGTMWIGTTGGLNRFDPATGTFVRYRNDPADPRSISHDDVRAIYEDPSGFLWIGTEDGLDRLDGTTGSFERYRNDPGNPRSLSDNAVRALCVDREGVLWVGTENGLNSFDRRTGAFRRYRNVPGDAHSLSDNAVYALFEDARGTLWIGTHGGGLEWLDRDTGTFHANRNDPIDPATLSNNEVYSLYEDRSGVLWIGTWGGGVNKINTRRKQFTRYSHDPNDPNSLGQDIVWSILEDRDGTLWIGTQGGGLDRFDRRANRFTHFRHDPADPRSLGNDIVRIVHEDREGRLWLGTNGGGVDAFDRRTGVFTHYRHDRNDPGSLSHDEIRCIHEDREGYFWIGTNGGGLNRFDPKTGRCVRYRNDPLDANTLASDIVRTVFEDRSGVLWIGTQGRGLDAFDRRSGAFTHFRANPLDSTSLSSDFLMSIHESNAGTLWIATWGGGLDRFDREKRIFKSYTRADGLAGDAIYGILEDASGNLWLSTNNGLSRFDPKAETFKNYGIEDGLQSREFNAMSFFRSPSGEMFFGGIGGFNAFIPESIRDNPHVPPIAITSFTKLTRRVRLEDCLSRDGVLRLSHRDYVFSFEFAALDYVAPSKNRYAYTMEGLDREWFATDATKRFANYTTLRPGSYTFRVKGSNNDGVWNEEGASVRLVIMPPFWGTWWFRSLVALVAATAIAGLHRRRLQTVRLTAELLAAHDAQMSILPHDDPVVPGFDISGVCIPASEVGGDFFDYIWLNDGRTKFGIAVGDVSGKAMKAAMIAVMSNGMISAHANETFSPAGALSRINRPLYAKTSDTFYTALWLGQLDLPSRSCVFSNAGFIDPLLKSGRAVVSLESVGPKLPLGAFDNTVYEEKAVTIAPGEVLVLFSDGVTDARNAAREFYEHASLKRLIELLDTSSLSASDIKNAIVADVKRFMGSTPQFDDMTIVVVKAT